jgi:hypothetical protein
MHRNSAVLPVVVALIVAVVGQAAVLANDFGPAKASGSSNMITAAAVERTGAIDIPVGSGNHSSGKKIKRAQVARVGVIDTPVAPGKHPHRSRMVTTAPVARAGVIDIPTGP